MKRLLSVLFLTLLISCGDRGGNGNSSVPMSSSLSKSEVSVVASELSLVNQTLVQDTTNAIQYEEIKTLSNQYVELTSDEAAVLSSLANELI